MIHAWAIFIGSSKEPVRKHHAFKCSNTTVRHAKTRKCSFPLSCGIFSVNNCTSAPHVNCIFMHILSWILIFLHNLEIKKCRFSLSQLYFIYFSLHLQSMERFPPFLHLPVPGLSVLVPGLPVIPVFPLT